MPSTASTKPQNWLPTSPMKMVAGKVLYHKKPKPAPIMAAQMKISHDDAAKRFDEAQAKLQQTKDQAVQTAKNAADASAASASKASFAAFGVLLLGSIAAAIGGSIAVQRRLTVTHVGGPAGRIIQPRATV